MIYENSFSHFKFIEMDRLLSERTQSTEKMKYQSSVEVPSKNHIFLSNEFMYFFPVEKQKQGTSMRLPTHLATVFPEKLSYISQTILKY